MAASSGGQQPVPEPEQITRIKGLILQHLRPCLVNLLNQADIALQQNVNSDHGGPGKSTEENPHRLERAMEDVLNVCDLLEDYLETLKAAEIQTLSSTKYTPKPVSNNKTDTSQDTQSYLEYLNNVRNQINSRMELQELLSDFVRSKLT